MGSPYDVEQPAVEMSRSTMGWATWRPRMRLSHSSGIASMPQWIPAMPPAMHAVVSVSRP
jgi:hypothetical protein